MSAQPSLWDLPVTPYPATPHAKGSDTSRAAAKHITPKIGGLQKRVILALYEYGPLSDETLERLLGVAATRSSRPRRRELEMAGFVCDSGDRIKSESGLLVVLWTLTADGEALARELAE